MQTRTRSSLFYRAAFHTARLAGVPLGPWRGSTPLHILTERLARKAYPNGDDAAWVRNRWGDELFLSYSYHLDRAILINGTYDLIMHRFLDRRLSKGMVCMDVGANFGEVALHMGRKVGPAGVVYAFEPVPHVHDRLVKHIQRNAMELYVKAFDLAIADDNGRVTIAFTDENADNQALGSIVNTSRQELTQRITVQACTLDSFVEQHRITKIDLIKADVQGGEWLLLKGGRHVFSELGPDLLIEISPLDLIEVGKDSCELAHLIENFGYRIYSLGGNGMPASHLKASTLEPAFSSPNVLCTKREN